MEPPSGTNNNCNNAVGSNSMWLQESIVVPDPYSTTQRSSNGNSDIIRTSGCQDNITTNNNTETTGKSTGANKSRQEGSGSMMLPPPSPCGSSGRLQSVAMVHGTPSTSLSGTTIGGNNAATLAEELALTRMELDVARSKMMRMSEARPSVRLASLAAGRGSNGNYATPSTTGSDNNVVTELRRRITLLEKEKENGRRATEECITLRRQLSDLRTEVTTLTELHTTERQSADEWRQRCDKELELRRSAEESLQQAEAKAAEEVKKLQAEIASTKREHARALQEATSNSRKDAEERVQGMETIIASLRAELNDCQDKLSRTLRDCDHIQELRDQAVAQAEEAAMHAEAIQECFNESVAKAQQEREAAVEAVQAEWEARYDKLMMEVSATQRECETRRSQGTQLQEELHAMSDRYKETRQQLMQQETIVSELRNKLDTIRSTLEREKNEALTQLRTQLRKTIEEGADVAMRLRHDLRERTEELTATHAELRAVRDDAEQARHDAAELRAERDAKQQLQERALQQCQEATAYHRELEEQLDSASQQALDFKAERDSIEEELTQTITTLQEQLREVEQSHATEHAQWTKTRLELMKSEMAARREVSNITRELEDLRSEIRRSGGSINGNNNQLQHRLEEANRQVEELQERNEALVTECESLRQQLASRDLDITLLKSRAASSKYMSSNTNPVSTLTIEDNNNSNNVDYVTTMKKSVTMTSNPPSHCGSRAGSTTSNTPSTTYNNSNRSTGTAPKRERSALCEIAPQEEQRRAAAHNRINALPTKLEISIEPRRVFAVTGFEDRSFVDALEQRLSPPCEVVHIRANGGIPDSVTHLLTSGNLTVKLLCAAVRGCWLLPRAYADDCVKQRRWLPEEVYGYQHNTLPLEGLRVVFSAKFKRSRNAKTMRILLDEGKATIIEEEEDESSDEATRLATGQWDIVMCMDGERQRLANKIAAADNNTRALTWEGIVQELLPQECTQKLEMVL